MWIKLVSTVIHVVLVETEDQFVWRVNEKLGFSVKSMYRDLLLSNSLPERNVSWKIKVPLKIKIFLWYLKKRVILTGDNLAKRNWKGGKKCCFCNTDETIQHFFFECHVAKFVWNAVFYTFGIVPPKSVANLLGSWIRGLLFTA